jgi:tryptophan synthase alpha chain
MSMLISPSTPPRRAEGIVKACTGFVYLLARAGITGETAEPAQIETRVTRLRQMTDLPIAVGFGISSPEQVQAVVRYADAAIVGSALVRRMGDAVTQGVDPVAEAESFVRLLGEGLNVGPPASAGPISGPIPNNL